MRRHILRLALGICVGLSACVTGPRPQSPIRLLTSPLDTAKACAKWRWIGIRSPAADRCPDVPGWKVNPLFASKAYGQAQEAYDQQGKPYDRQQILKGKQGPEKLSSSDAAIQELNRFCVYEIEDSNQKPEYLPPPPTRSDKLIRVDQDCAAISPNAGWDWSLWRANWKGVSKHFLSQAGRTRLEIHNLHGVRLAFLDTQPTKGDVPKEPGRSMHGYTLTHIARNLICSPEASDRCAAQITTRLALPIVHFDAGSQRLTQIDERREDEGGRGGYLGMPSDLAKAIKSEVGDWLEARQGPDSPQHLVLNLSVAWDGELLGGLNEAQIADMQAGTQAVYRALEYARSLDVLVLAAAGNQKKCLHQTDGPLLPAAWERGAVPAESCGATPKPLVYAVGGVRSDGRPLTNARPRGTPRRVAYAENAIVPTGDPIQQRIYTGSSIATAVASSIAAVVWDSFPHLNSDEVMKILDASGDELTILDASGNERPRLADFWFNTGALPIGAPTVHRLSLCTALKAACDQSLSDPCPLQSADACDPWIPRRMVFPAWAARPPLSRTCDPWLHPQPDDPPCPNPGCHSG